MHGSKFSFLSILIFFQFILNAQITFKKQFHNNARYSYASNMLQTFDHGYLLMSTIVDRYTYQTWLIKTNETGDTLWSKLYSYGQRGWINEGVVQCPDSGFAVLGFKNGVYLLRLTKNGDSLWGKELGRGESYSIAITSQKEFIISGIATDSTLLFIRADYDGGLIFHKDIYITPPPGYISSPEGYSIKPTHDDGAIIGGTSVPGQLDPVTYVFLVKTDYSGNVQWVNRVTYLDEAYGFSVDNTKDTGFVFAGSYRDGAFLLKTTFMGDTLWVKKYLNPSYQYFSSVTTCKEGDYTACGYYHKFSTLFEHVLLTKTSQAGSFVWSTNLYSAPLLQGYCVKQTIDGGFCIYGNIRDEDSSYVDRILIKTDASGNVAWIKNIANTAQYSVYPNPSSEDITIEKRQTTGDESIEILDMNGICRIKEKFEQGKNSIKIHIAALTPGEYLLRISSGNKLLLTKKIIKI